MEWKPTDVTILFVYCWISTCFGPTGPSSGEFVQLFTQPLVLTVSVPLCSRALYVVACLCDYALCTKTGHNIQSTRTEQHRHWTTGCVNSCTNSPEDGPMGPKHVEIQQYTNKIVTSVGFHSICEILKLLLTLRRLMSYIYGAPILDVSRSHTTTQHSR